MSSPSRSFDRLCIRWPVLQQIDSGVLIGAVIIVLCVVIFLFLADHVRQDRWLVVIDQAIADELHQQGLSSPEAIAGYKIISMIGLPGIWVVGVLVGLFFVIRRQWLHLSVWTVALIGGILLNNFIKLIFARPRPIFSDPFVIEQQFSFPSGHAMITIIGAGLLAYFVCMGLNSHIGRIVVIFAAALVTIVMGISRMALGVHFFSDVIGGFAAGGGWLALSVTTLDQLLRRQLRKDAAPKPASMSVTS